MRLLALCALSDQDSQSLREAHLLLFWGKSIQIVLIEFLAIDRILRRYVRANEGCTIRKAVFFNLIAQCIVPLHAG